VSSIDRDWLIEKIEKVVESIHSIDKTLAAQEVQLTEHIRRTQAAEDNIELLRKELKPVQEHVARMDGALRFLGILSLVAGVAAAIHKVLN